MLCKKCACENFPYEQTCWFCDNTMQSPAESASHQEEWNKLTAELRNEIEARITQQQVKYQEYVTNLGKKRVLHILTGAGIILFTDIITLTGSFGIFAFFIDTFLGSVAGRLLNANKGGTYYGLFLFVTAYTASAVIRGTMSSILEFGMGAFIAGIAGYLFGNSLEIKRIDSW
ncbi:MAG: hypothetical protein HZA48_09960 [Planctomycetes bacterium]|nr:hypothetical protein [Planctomycetota bacterium]